MTKHFKILSIKEDHEIGQIEFNNETKVLQIHLIETSDQKFHQAIAKILENILLERGLSQEFDQKNLLLNNIDESFLSQLKQELAIMLKIRMES